MKNAWLLVLAVMLLAGCASPVVPEGRESRAPPQTLSPLPGFVVAEERLEDGYAFDALCVFGGGWEMTRSAGRIVSGYDRLAVEVDLDATFTGIQIGYSIDRRDTHWLDTVGPGSSTQEIRILEYTSEAADGPVRWRFEIQNNVQQAEQDCYTGGGAGSFHIVIRTIPPDGEVAEAVEDRSGLRGG